MNLRSYLRGIGIGMLVTAIILTIARQTTVDAMSDAEIRERAEKLGMIDADEALMQQAEALAERPKTADASSTEAPSEAALEAASETPASAASETASEASSEAAPEASSESASAGPSETAAEAAPETSDVPSSSGAVTDVPAESRASSQSGKNGSDVVYVPVAGAGAEEESDQLTAGSGAARQKPSGSGASGSGTQSGTSAAAGTEEKPSGSGASGSNTVFTVRSGIGSDQVARDLQKQGLIQNAAAFDDYLCANGYDRYLASGSHNIPAGATEEQIARILTGR